MNTELDKFFENNEIKIDTDNISDYPVVFLDRLKNIRQEIVELEDKKFNKYVADYEGKTIRIPLKILIEMKEMRKEYDFNQIRVKKSGEGIKTQYTLMALDLKEKSKVE